MDESLFQGMVISLGSKPPVIGGSESLSGEGTQIVPGDPNASGAAGTSAPARGGGFDIILVGMLVFFVFLIMSTMMQNRKEKRRKQELFGGLAKHDRVQTIGGIIGTIAEIADNEIVLRVDEATNTRVRVARAAIQTVLKKGRGPGSEAEPKPEQAEANV